MAMVADLEVWVTWMTTVATVSIVRAGINADAVFAGFPRRIRHDAALDRLRRLARDFGRIARVLFGAHAKTGKTKPGEGAAGGAADQPAPGATAAKHACQGIEPVVVHDAPSRR